MTLEGTRKWNKGSVDFMGHLCGVMKSLWSHRRERFKTVKHQEPLLESETIKMNDEGEQVNPLEDIESDQPDPERDVSASQCVERIVRYFENVNDTEVSLIIEGLREGMTPQEIQENLGLSQNQIQAAMKRMRRNVRKIFSDEEE